MKSLVKFLLNSPLALIFRVRKATTEYCRVGFVLTAISEGIYDIISHKPMTCKNIQKALGSDVYQEGLEAWLDLGVSLGELKKSPRGYTIKGLLSKELSKPENDAWLAYLQARAEIFYDYIKKTPSMIKQNKQFEFSESYGELFARSSRTIEPIMRDLVDSLMSQKGLCRLLEIGCGSGVYIKQACDRNPELTAVGLELQPGVADFARKNMRDWELEDRVTIETADIRDYKGIPEFDLVTFYNLIYYFPIDERVDLLKCIGKNLNPGGELVVTSLCQGRDLSLHLMNLWSSMTKGCGPLPYPEQIHDHLKKAGYNNIKSQTLIPSFVLFKANKQH